jgi:hypothetical protein
MLMPFVNSCQPTCMHTLVCAYVHSIMPVHQQIGNHYADPFSWVFPICSLSLSPSLPFPSSFHLDRATARSVTPSRLSFLFVHKHCFIHSNSHTYNATSKYEQLAFLFSDPYIHTYTTRSRQSRFRWACSKGHVDLVMQLLKSEPTIDLGFRSDWFLREAAKNGRQSKSLLWPRQSLNNNNHNHIF